MKKQGNREYKDRLFKIIFGREENKRFTLDLYNAINNSHYTNVDDLKIVTLEDALYVNMKNDVSFIFSDKLSLYEQQSTINPNMPLRMLLYSSEQLNEYIVENKLDLHSSKLQRIPTPKFIVFYNGMDNFPERQVLYLSDSFKNGNKGDLEAKVMVYNINGRNNVELKKKCPALFEYSDIVDYIQKGQKEGRDLFECIEEVLTNLPDEYVLKDLLLSNRGEVMNVLFKEYTEEDYKKTGFNDGYSDGFDDGVNQGVLKAKREDAKNLLSLNVNEDVIKKAMNVTQDTINQLKKELKL